MKSAPVPTLSLHDRCNLVLAVLTGGLTILLLGPLLLPLWIVGRITSWRRSKAGSEGWEEVCAR